MARKPVQEGLNIVGKAWSEIKKINWHEVNRLCQQNFHIGLVGSDQEVGLMKNWLRSFPYILPNTCARIGSKTNKFEQSLTEIDTRQGEISDKDEKLVKSTTFCLATPGMADELRRLKGEVYIFDSANTYSLTTQILSNHPEVQFALAHNFPVFRPEMAQMVIQDTAFQNTAWALVSSASTSVPGVSFITSPVEGISDFTVLTLNEIKLMFELVGISGYRVVPLYHLVEFAMVGGIAKLAESVATTAVARLPGRTAVLIKGAIAYAFTWTIGEALFFYISTGHKLGRDVFSGRFHRHFVRGREVAAGLLCPCKAGK